MIPGKESVGGIGLCQPLFVHRASYPDAACDVASCRTWIIEQRVGEFWQLFGYVLLLRAAIVGLVVGPLLLIRHLARHLHRGSRSGTHGNRRHGGEK
ncbi:hypothetical protein WT81_30200 [Burkholderia stagnalis]|nr:hypothetical protein WT81_30200 [Burkholderia stagnalis]KWK57358.1 hypothetical protein WT80_30365 [Burkholderia stagnalis]